MFVHQRAPRAFVSSIVESTPPSHAEGVDTPMIPPKRSHVLSEYEIARAGSRQTLKNDPCEHNKTEEQYL